MADTTAPVPLSGLLYELTARQRLWVEEYGKHQDPVKASKALGYKNPRAAGERMLETPAVVRAVEALLEQKRAADKVDSDKIVRELASVGFSNPKRMLGADGQLLPLADLPDEVAASIQSMKVSYGVDQEGGELISVRNVEIKFWNKLEALKQLAQHLGLLKDAAQVNNQQTVQIINWDSLLQAGRGAQVPGALARREADPLEQQIRALQQQALPGPVKDEENVITVPGPGKNGVYKTEPGAG